MPITLDGTLGITTPALTSTGGANFATSSGNVGIGTASPSYSLHISKAVPTLMIECTGSATNGSAYALLKADTGATGNYFRALIGADAAGSYNWAIGNYSTNDSKALAFYTNGFNERMRVHSSGGVSIGNTTDPGATNLSVTGNVTAPNLQGPAFSAYLSGNQSLTANVVTKVAFDTKLFDTNTCFSTANNRFTPNVAGYYHMTFAMYIATASVGIYTMNFYKNGALYKQSNYNIDPAGALMANCTTLVYMNGTTDYVEAWASTQYASTLGGSAGAPYFEFSGALVRSA